jgi:DNA-binding transcriptional LysR family regulator
MLIVALIHSDGMELRHLRYFCAVAQEQSFTLAARRLHVSQSGVSGQIRDLEAELGVTLFRRTQRTVSLTPEGSAFLSSARDILDRAERAVEMLKEASSGRYGKLNTGLCGPATAPFLLRLIKLFRKHQPGVTLSLKELNPALQPEALVSGQLDIGFTRGLPASFKGILASKVYFREPLLAAIPQDHDLERPGAVSLKDLAQRSRPGAREFLGASE